MSKKLLVLWAALVSLAAVQAPAAAQIREVDPNSAIDADLREPAPEPESTPQPVQSYPQDSGTTYPDPYATTPPATTTTDQPVVASQERAAEQARDAAANTYNREDLLGAAEGVFGQGAAGLAGVIEDILSKQGEPNAYIAGREAAGAFVVGLRYGSGTMFHAVEGQRPVYWTGPSVGFDVGGDASKVFVLVYNLYDSQELYKRFPSGEGRVYFIGGFAVTYLRRGDVVLIPVRLGVGWRAGINAGYMKFTEESRWMPF